VEESADEDCPQSHPLKTAEGGFFGLVRRGVYGTYHHWGRAYLQQYLNEFDFRYNNRKVNDSDRTMLMLKATEGKRLTLREPRSASA
jgi:hypothetical protein